MMTATPMAGDKARAGDRDLLRAVDQVLDQAGLDGDHMILIAYSGGLDSSVLVDLLDRKRQRGGPALRLVHVDHGLRPSARDDADFCQTMARQRGLSIDVVALAMDDRRFRGQQAARQARLAAIGECALECGADAVAFAHHGDDRLESLLLNLCRGTGLDGLAAMASVETLAIGADLVPLIRPLLPFGRPRLARYAEDHEIAYVTDPSNADDRYERNRIRHQLLPELVPDEATQQAAFQAIANLDQEQQAAAHYAKKLGDDARINAPGLTRQVFALPRLQQAPRATVMRLMRSLQPALDAPSQDRIWERIIDPPGAGSEHLTLKGCVITVSAERLVFETSFERGAKDVLSRRACPIELTPFEGGKAPFFEGMATWGLGPASAIEADDCWSAIFEPDELPETLFLSAPPSGARLARQRPQGPVYHQQLSKIFSEFGVPADLRWRWPCLIDDRGQLIWAGGLPRGVAALPGDKTDPIWALRLPGIGEWDDPGDQRR